MLLQFCNTDFQGNEIERSENIYPERMMPINSANQLKITLDNYFTVGKDGVETPEIISDILMKNGYVRYYVICN